MTTSRTASPLAAISRVALGQHGLLTRAQAVTAGCSDEVLEGLCRKGVLVRVHRGVLRFTSSRATSEQRVLAACLASRGVACHLTAVALYGFDLAGVSLLRPPDVLSATGKHAPRKGAYHVYRTRRLPAEEVVERRGVPVTAPVRTVRDVAGLLPPAELDRFLGHLLATGELRPDDLLKLGTDPSTALRAAVARAGVTTAPDSDLEHRALLLMRAAGLPEPVPQFPVHAGGRLVGSVDYAWPDRAVVLEVDGYRWHAGPAQFSGDRRRDNRLRELGWTVYRTTASELAEGAAPLLRQLGRALGGARSGPATENLDRPSVPAAPRSS